ncbi:hypothetical protein TSO221_32685 [Azospirillum sp. TSO22-1]|nr:hypothetical protein TSO221_32685 [Azospirillum sp. TSO22-1]
MSGSVIRKGILQDRIFILCADLKRRPQIGSCIRDSREVDIQSFGDAALFLQRWQTDLCSLKRALCDVPEPHTAMCLSY